MGGICCSDKKNVIVPDYKPVATRVETPITPVATRFQTPITPVATRFETPFKPVTPKYEETKIKSASIQREFSAKASFTNIGISTTNPLKLIEGYEDEPLVSLEAALNPFNDKIDQLSYCIREAKKKCYYPSEHSLTHDESAAIYIYTMKRSHGCLYDHLQTAWESKDPSKLKPWFKYLRLFKSAFDKLPDAKTEIWQGKWFDETLKEQLSSNSLSLYSSMGLCSSSKNEVKEYLERHGAEQMLLVGYNNIGAKLANDYTAANSNQFMVFPGMKLGLSNCEMYDTNGSFIFHLTGPTITKRPKSIKTPIIETHFVCQNNYCDNRCRGNHETNHCYGFAFLSHTCQHHCVPTQECFRCKRHLTDLRECNKCQSRYCEKCSSKKIMLKSSQYG